MQFDGAQELKATRLLAEVGAHRLDDGDLLKARCATATQPLHFTSPTITLSITGIVGLTR